MNPPSSRRDVLGSRLKEWIVRIVHSINAQEG